LREYSKASQSAYYYKQFGVGPSSLIYKKVMEFEKQNKEKENRDLVPSEYLEYERQTTN